MRRRGRKARTFSTLTSTRAKLIADDKALMKRAKAETVDRMRFGALVNAYSFATSEVNISAMATRMYGPETIQTLYFDGHGTASSLVPPSGMRVHSDGRLSWQGELA